jgi:phage shock protein A
MFKKLKDAIDGALSALEGRSGDAANVDELLGGMRQELIEAKAALPRLEAGIEKLQQLQAQERRRAEDCVRRAGQAQEIGDEETLRLAVEYAERHRERVRVYDEKLAAARSELALQRRTVDEMKDQLKSAMTHRDVLKIRARRSATSESLRDAGQSAAARFDRMAEEIEDEATRAEASRELDEELGLTDVDRSSGFGRRGGWDDGGIPPDDLAELRLEELKRRMAEEGDGEG